MFLKMWLRNLVSNEKNVDSYCLIFFQKYPLIFTSKIVKEQKPKLISHWDVNAFGNMAANQKIKTDFLRTK